MWPVELIQPVPVVQPVQPVEMVQLVQPVPVIQPIPTVEPVAVPVANTIPPPMALPEAAGLVPFNRPPIHRLRSYSTGHLPLNAPIVNQVTLVTTTIRYPNGDVYIGQVDETGVPHGEGEYTWADGSRYVGTWRMGFKEGFGVYEALTGYRYWDGKWNDVRWKRLYL
jgi:hypothetical protein